MKCPNCNRPLKKLKGKHKFAVNISNSQKEQDRKVGLATVGSANELPSDKKQRR